MVPNREWRMFAPSLAPGKGLEGQLEFALKREGVSLAVLRALFGCLDPAEIVRMVRDKPTGAYVRRIWFLYEWLMDTRPRTGGYVGPKRSPEPVNRI